jgi:Cse1
MSNGACRDGMKAAICNNCLQFLQMQEEDIAEHLEVFVTTIWGLLVGCGSGRGQDNLAQAAMAFLTSVCRSTHYRIFEAGDTIHQVRRRKIMPAHVMQPEV